MLKPALSAEIISGSPVIQGNGQQCEKMVFAGDVKSVNFLLEVSNGAYSTVFSAPVWKGFISPDIFAFSITSAIYCCFFHPSLTILC